MNRDCSQCGNPLNSVAKFCGCCGSAVLPDTQVVEPAPPVFVEARPIQVVPPEVLAVRREIEAFALANSVINHERMKLKTMTIAARGGSGTVGFWAED